MEKAPRRSYARRVIDQRPTGSWLGPITALCGFAYPISVVVINKNLPEWCHYNPNDPLGPTLTGTATLIGLAAVVGTMLMGIRRSRDATAVSLGGLIGCAVLASIALLLLFVNGQVWFKLYKVL